MREGILKTVGFEPAEPKPEHKEPKPPPGASRDPYLGKRATTPDYAAYVRWCRWYGIKPLAKEPLSYGIG
jgi:hypothetical protein